MVSNCQYFLRETHMIEEKMLEIVHEKYKERNLIELCKRLFFLQETLNYHKKKLKLFPQLFQKLKQNKELIKSCNTIVLSEDEILFVPNAILESNLLTIRLMYDFLFIEEQIIMDKQYKNNNLAQGNNFAFMFFNNYNKWFRIKKDYKINYYEIQQSFPKDILNKKLAHFSLEDKIGWEGLSQISKLLVDIISVFEEKSIFKILVFSHLLAYG